jgi:hypothetical protein
MNFEKASQIITDCAVQMTRLYGSAVFNELVIVSFVGDREEVVGYVGPRPERVQNDFAQDLRALKEELFSSKHGIGEFEFARSAEGTHFDAFIVVGEWLYLICNNTSLSMNEITKKAEWRQAQVPFVEMSERFRADPLRLG